MTTPYYLRLGREDARRLRADHLIAVHAQVMTPGDVIDAATAPTNLALRDIQLKDLYLSADTVSPSAWDSVRRRTLAVLGLEAAHHPDKKLTIGWLIDPRASGRRYYAFSDALRTCHVDRQPPWPVFPWTPLPDP